MLALDRVQTHIYIYIYIYIYRRSFHSFFSIFPSKFKIIILALRNHNDTPGI